MTAAERVILACGTTARRMGAPIVAVGLMLGLSAHATPFRNSAQDFAVRRAEAANTGSTPTRGDDGVLPISSILGLGGVPEPSTLLLLGFGMVGLVARRRREKAFRDGRCLP